ISYAIPGISFAFTGVETVAVTAFEAQTSRSLRLPSQSIAYTTTLLYFLCLLGQCLNVSWTSDHLPGRFAENPHDPSSSSLTIIALWIWGKKGLAGFINGAMIFSCLSSGNTSLYLASRTLYGLALQVPRTNRLGKLCHSFSVVVPQTGVPAGSLFISAVAFVWLPFLRLQKGRNSLLVEIIQLSASVSCFIVWAALSLAYLRYYLWLKKCKRHLTGDHEQYVRNTKTYKPYTVLAWGQPIPSIISISGCIVIIAFCSARWWDSDATVSKVIAAYAAPTILLTLFIALKIINRRLWIRTSNDFTKLSVTLARLKWYKNDEIEAEDKRRTEATRVLSPPLERLQPTTETLPTSNLAVSTDLLGQRNQGLHVYSISQPSSGRSR
ncbi:hypothetical protein B0J11DRAFT_425375, partial [Dendryphion nanum]